jgi:uncharacterized membrane protein YvbJ
MAIIACPGCGKRISDRQSRCPHCDAVIGELTMSKQEQDDLQARTAQRRSKQRVYWLNVVAILLVLAFAGLGAAFLLQDPREISDAERAYYFYGFVALAIAFVAVRGWIVLVKRRF